MKKIENDKLLEIVGEYYDIALSRLSTCYDGESNTFCIEIEDVFYPNEEIRKDYKYMIVNSRLEEIPTTRELTLEFEYDLPCANDDYGMGSCNWSLVKTKEEAVERQLKDNVNWAKRRLGWAKEKASYKEVMELEEIIATKGKSRNNWCGLQYEVKV